jgi:hypothetical protein
MITVMYSCEECGVVDAKCEVPARDTEDEDVRDWMNRLIYIVSADHRSLHPKCKTKKLINLKIPLKGKDGPEAEFIGQQID